MHTAGPKTSNNSVAKQSKWAEQGFTFCQQHLVVIINKMPENIRILFIYLFLANISDWCLNSYLKDSVQPQLRVLLYVFSIQAPSLANNLTILCVTSPKNIYFYILTYFTKVDVTAAYHFKVIAEFPNVMIQYYNNNSILYCDQTGRPTHRINESGWKTCNSISGQDKRVTVNQMFFTEPQLHTSLNSHTLPLLGWPKVMIYVERKLRLYTRVLHRGQGHL